MPGPVSDSYPGPARRVPKRKRPIPISSAAFIANTYGYDQVLIYARAVGEDGGEHMTTYGVNQANCDAAAKIGDHLKYEVMGWTRDNAALLEDKTTIAALRRADVLIESMAACTRLNVEGVRMLGDHRKFMQERIK